MPDKAAVRKHYLKQRQALGEAERERLSRLIVEHALALPALREANTIMAYMAFRGEVSTQELMEHILRAGKRLVLPRVERERQLIGLEVRDVARDVKVGSYGIMEPISHCCPLVSPGDLDAIIVPGVAFTPCGYRLGYGGGYYDRFLSDQAAQAVAIGLAFQIQIASCLPVEFHDRPVDWVVTEHGVCPDSPAP